MPNHGQEKGGKTRRRLVVIERNTPGDRARYALARLGGTIRLLAIGEGDVRSRLFSAYREFAPIFRDDFPTHLQPRFDSIKKSLTRFEATHGEGTVAATLSRIRNSTGTRIASSIVALESELRAFCEAADQEELS